MDARLQVAGLTGVTSVASNNPNAYKIQLGYQLDDRWAIEGGYADLGRVSYNATGTLLGATVAASEAVKMTAWNINAIGKIPVTDAVCLLGKFGFTRVEMTDNVVAPRVGAAFWINANTIKTGVTYGLAMKININKQISARADMDSYDTGVATGRVNVWTLGVSYHF
jgi:OOP family OmpA-OmpF porin